jgi:putative transposase
VGPQAGTLPLSGLWPYADLRRRKAEAIMPENMINVLVHFVWATWDRLPLIEPAIERDIHRSIVAICEDNGCPVLGIGGMPDHVHILVSLSNTMTMAKLMELAKGGSSRYITTVLHNLEWFKWQGSYGAFSVSPHEKQKVINYINNQKAHHADRTIWPTAERTDRNDTA